jgi:hypothetical protein
MPKHSVLICQFPYGGSTRQSVSDWMVRTVCQMKADPRIGEIRHTAIDDTPISMSRNRACRLAQKHGCELVLMVDNDMWPDLSLMGAVEFWGQALDFLLAHHGPAIIAAPYCGPPPHENVYVFRWANRQSDTPDADFHLAQYTREEAAFRGGIEEVAALPTGLILFPTAALEQIPVPWFEYEYTDQYRTDKATTEDVYFTRNASLAGVPVYCLWDSWAGHWKSKCVSKPQPMTSSRVGAELKAALSRPADGERLIDVPQEGITLAPRGRGNGRAIYPLFSGATQPRMHPSNGGA